MQLVVNDPLSGWHPGFAFFAVALGHGVQVVDVQQVHAGDLGDLRIDITGNRHVDDQQGTAGAPRLEALDLGGIEDMVRGAAGGQDDVHVTHDLVDCIEADGLAAERLRHLVGALERSRGEVDVPDPLLPQEAQGDLTHLAGANQQDVPAVEVAEDAGRRGHGGMADRDGTSSDSGFMARALCRPDRAAGNDLESRVQASGLPGCDQRLLELSEDLRLADHHGIEAAGHPEEMRDGLLVTELVGIAPPRFEGQRVRP